jgi:beta-xylosidase
MVPPPSLRRGASALALLAAMFACSGEPGTPSAANPTDAGSVDAPEPTPPANPVYARDFADPFVLVAESRYYAYATNTSSANVPILESHDLTVWTPSGDAMPALPAWAESGKSLTWAPAVIALNGGYVLFFTARDHRSGRQCIGRADSTSPLGPFVDRSPVPFICQADLGGSIDASPVHDVWGRVYLVWKNDGNCCHLPVTLWSQLLSEDGRTLVGARAALLHRDQAWEGPLIEGPTMWEDGEGWHLLYSANMWDTDKYATGAATCDSPLGPCRKTGTAPMLVSDPVTAGPGGAETFTDLDGARWIAYHGWSRAAIGYQNGGARSLRLDRIEVTGPNVRIAN